MEKMDLLYICDNAFAELAGISLTSLFENNQNSKFDITVYLLTVDVSEENKQNFSILAQKYNHIVKIIDVKEILIEIQQLDIATYRNSAMTNIRLYFERFVPDNVQRLLYLDCDTIICDSLEELFRFDLSGKLLGMVLDAYGVILNRTQEKNSAYYNAGVILIDCNKWRREQWSVKIIEYIRQYGADFSHPDQDIYNIVCKDDIIKLPIRYNFQTVHRMYSEKLFFRFLAPNEYYSEIEIAEARERPSIVHMIRTLGSNPWNSKRYHPDNSLFRYYKNHSLWRHTPMVQVKSDFFIRIERILYKILPSRFFFPISLCAIKIAQHIDLKNKY